MSLSQWGFFLNHCTIFLVISILLFSFSLSYTGPKIPLYAFVSKMFVFYLSWFVPRFLTHMLKLCLLLCYLVLILGFRYETCLKTYQPEDEAATSTSCLLQKKRKLKCIKPLLFPYFCSSQGSKASVEFFSDNPNRHFLKLCGISRGKQASEWQSRNPLSYSNPHNDKLQEDLRKCWIMEQVKLGTLAN